LETQSGVEQLFFELASENRLDILRELRMEPRKIQEIGRRLKLTDTEAFRQVHRLDEASLIQKQPEGTYAITQYGKLVLQLSRPLEFVFRNKQCFLTRDVWRLPPEFIDRLGELFEAKLNMNMIDMLNISDQGVSEAEDHVWAMGDKPLGPVSAKVEQRISKGIKLRLLIPESLSPLYKDIREVPDIVEKRMLPSVPVNMLCTEKAAGVSLLSIDGRPDNALFFGRDEAFRKWAGDLFLYYWDKGKHCY
jgi:predicted transcriptional regulator